MVAENNAPKSPFASEIVRHLPRMSPRHCQTLAGIIDGLSEKQIAARLRISQHTVHVYMKQIYKRFGVSSRGELHAILLRIAFAAGGGTGLHSRTYRYCPV